MCQHLHQFFAFQFSAIVVVQELGFHPSRKKKSTSHNDAHLPDRSAEASTSREQVPMESTERSITAVAEVASWTTLSDVPKPCGPSLASAHLPGGALFGRLPSADVTVRDGNLFLEEFLLTTPRRHEELRRTWDATASPGATRGASGAEGREQGRRVRRGVVGILVTPRSSTVERSSGRSLHPTYYRQFGYCTAQVSISK